MFVCNGGVRCLCVMMVLGATGSGTAMTGLVLAEAEIFTIK